MSWSPPKRRWALALAGLLGCLYPLIVYLGIDRLPVYGFALLAVLLIALRAWAWQGARAFAPFAPLLGGFALAQLAIYLLAPATLAKLSYPVVMSLAMASVFALSALRPPTLIERFAAFREPTPEPAAIRYMRRLNGVWCVFLCINAALSIATALADDLALWTLYNGLLSYLAMGALFFGETIYRRWRGARYEAGR